MKQKPIIGIVPTYNIKNEKNDPYQEVSKFVKMYEEKITQAGGIAIGLLNPNPKDYLKLCDGYLYPGGNKVLMEYNMIFEDAIKNNKPVLGICLGAEAISIFLNVLEDKKKEPNLNYEEIYIKNRSQNAYLKKLNEPNIHNNTVTKEEKTIKEAKHKIKIVKNSIMHKIYKEEKIDVVSLHSTGINRMIKKLISATSEDNEIEAIEYNDNILGVMFHPEITEDSKIFEWLIQKSQK